MVNYKLIVCSWRMLRSAYTSHQRHVRRVTSFRVGYMSEADTIPTIVITLKYIIIPYYHQCRRLSFNVESDVSVCVGASQGGFWPSPPSCIYFSLFLIILRIGKAVEDGGLCWVPTQLECFSFPLIPHLSLGLIKKKGYFCPFTTL